MVKKDGNNLEKPQGEYGTIVERESTSTPLLSLLGTIVIIHLPGSLVRSYSSSPQDGGNELS